MSYRAASPRVSILIAVSREGSRLTACLQSLSERLSIRGDCELILVVNRGIAAMDNEAGLWSDRVSVVQTDTTLGVPLACNLAATRSRGEYLALLDEQATIEPGWLEWLVHTADVNPDAGAVGSALLFPDGRLQEAGAILWGDGSVTSVGRGTQGHERTWRFVRAVDCASSRALLVRRAIWDRIGGFDPAFSADVYRDVDLCLRIRAVGKQVLFEPRSRVTVEERPGPSDLDAFIQTSCRQKLARRWEHELLIHEPASSGAMNRAVHRARGYPRRLLVVDDLIPDPGAGAGFGRMFEALIELTEAGWAISHHPTLGASALPDALVDCGVSIVEGDIGRHLAESDTWYDAVIISRPYNVEPVWRLVRSHQPGARLIYDNEALWWRRVERQAALTTDQEAAARLRADAVRLREVETRNVQICDFTITVSEEERALLSDAGVDMSRIRTLPPFERGARMTGSSFQERRDVGFVAGWMAGGSGSPNGDGLLWFVHNVLPRIRRAIPSVTLHVTGRNPPAELLALADANICFEGHVEDLAAFYNHIRVAVVPNRFGSGVKLKTVQALQHAVPTVSTSVGAEGLDLASVGGLRVSDDPVMFAADVAMLLTDEREWNQSRAALAIQVAAWENARLIKGSWPELLSEWCARGTDDDRQIRIER